MSADSPENRPVSSSTKAIAALWGFAEATLFFIVPDLWTSVAGRTRLRSGLVACLFALAGALAGGTVMYVWGALEPDTASRVVEKVPAISGDMMEQARIDMHERGQRALFFGPLRVTPYKVYSIYSVASGIAYLNFIMISALSRLIRFCAITIFCHYALKLLPVLRIKVDPLIVLVASWIIFYAFFFYLLPN